MQAKDPIEQFSDNNKAAFEEVESFVSMDYVMKKTRESQDKKVELLRSKYRIVIEDNED